MMVLCKGKLNYGWMKERYKEISGKFITTGYRLQSIYVSIKLKNKEKKYKLI